MQKLKVKQLDGVVSPSASDDWSSLTEQLVTAAATSEKINNAVSGAMGGALQSVTGGSAETGKYVSAVTKEGTAVKVAKTALPVTGVNTSNTAGSGTTTKRERDCLPRTSYSHPRQRGLHRRNLPHQASLCRECRGCLRQRPYAAAHRLHSHRQQTHLQRPQPLRQRRHRQHPLPHRRLIPD